MDQPRWCQVRDGQLRHQGCDGWTDDYQTADGLQASTSGAHGRWAADSNGAMVARSQITVAGSTVTLVGTLTNETGCDVYFSGLPPFAITIDADGSERVLQGDFNSPPREIPSRGDWVVHPGASLNYRSLPVTVQTPDPRWDGTTWCTSSQSTTMHLMTFCKTLDSMTFCSQRRLPTIQLFTGPARFFAHGSAAPIVELVSADIEDQLERC
ncbi:MAG: hypothetical protein HHJ11_15590 [Phycicoccus sp.]|nr:hypothetical protein [Phycicoccus sp.]NMM33010.1 hypothetical protein [Phycicoccus sp.]